MLIDRIIGLAALPPPSPEPSWFPPSPPSTVSGNEPRSNESRPQPAPKNTDTSRRDEARSERPRGASERVRLFIFVLPRSWSRGSWGKRAGGEAWSGGRERADGVRKSHPPAVISGSMVCDSSPNFAVIQRDQIG